LRKSTGMLHIEACKSLKRLQYAYKPWATHEAQDGSDAMATAKQQRKERRAKVILYYGGSQESVHCKKNF